MTGGPDHRRRRSRPSGSSSPAARSCRRSGATLGARIPSAGVRHQVVVTEPHADVAPERLPMVFDLVAGVYWRPCEGGVMWGMSNPDEPPGDGPRVRLGLLREDARAGGRADAGDRPARAAPRVGRDHRLHARTTCRSSGPLLVGDGPPADLERIDGTTVAAAGGHGMMWGPGVARAAADLALTGTTDLVDADRARPGPLRRGRPLAAGPPTRSPCRSPRGPDR